MKYLQHVLRLEYYGCQVARVPERYLHLGGHRSCLLHRPVLDYRWVSSWHMRK